MNIIAASCEARSARVRIKYDGVVKLWRGGGIGGSRNARYSVACIDMASRKYHEAGKWQQALCALVSLCMEMYGMLNVTFRKRLAARLSRRRPCAFVDSEITAWHSWARRFSRPGNNKMGAVACPL